MLNKATETKRQLVCLCEWIQNDAQEHLIDGATDKYINQSEMADEICIKLFANEPILKNDRAFLKQFYGSFEFVTRGRWEHYYLIDYLDAMDCKAEEEIVIDIYGKKERWIDRNKAIDSYWNCVVNSDGAERLRYVYVIEMLKDGATYIDSSDY